MSSNKFQDRPKSVQDAIEDRLKDHGYENAPWLTDVIFAASEAVKDFRTSPSTPTREQIAAALRADLGWTDDEVSDFFTEHALFSQPSPMGQYVQVAGRTLCVICWRFDGDHDAIPKIGHVGSQPSPSADPGRVIITRDQIENGVREVFQDEWPEPDNAPALVIAAILARARYLPVTEPPRIAEMAPGTMVETTLQWTVIRGTSGWTFLYRDDNGYAQFMPADAVDLSAVRSVVPPHVVQKDERCGEAFVGYENGDGSCELAVGHADRHWSTQWGFWSL